MRTEVRNQIEMLGKPVAAEVPRRRNSHRRWLRLGPSEAGVSLLEVEVPADVDAVEHAKQDEDYLVLSQENFSSLDDAVAALKGRGVNTDGFDATWKNDNPF